MQTKFRNQSDRNKHTDYRSETTSDSTRVDEHYGHDDAGGGPEHS